ncbi:MAG: hypothetical protein IJX25_01010, partial [Clostridia bacterium]|nr:hypothetical protein [Clostridia bacterium]
LFIKGGAMTKFLRPYFILKKINDLSLSERDFREFGLDKRQIVNYALHFRQADKIAWKIALLLDVKISDLYIK